VEWRIVVEIDLGKQGITHVVTQVELPDGSRGGSDASTVQPVPLDTLKKECHHARFILTP
jgi:hypothetical protein